VDYSSFMRTVSISARGRGTLLSVAERLVRLVFLAPLVHFAAILPVNALSTVAPCVANATRREEKLPWAHKITAK
jgi:hypothetical protein